MKDIFEEVRKSEAYKSLPKDVKLSHVFLMLPQEFNPILHNVDDYEIQFGFLDSKQNKITVIKYNQGDITALPADDPYTQNSKIKIEPIDLAATEISIKKAFTILGNLIKEEYKGNVPLKTIVVLQKLEGLLTWNITILRADFKTLNVKINAETGEVISHSLKGLIHTD